MIVVLKSDLYLCSKSNDMTQITVTELMTLLMNVDKPTFVHLVTETEPKMRKTGNPYFGKIVKRSSCNYLMGTDYEKRVIRNGEKEGISKEENTFEVSKPSGKEHISKCVLKSTKEGVDTKYYLMVERFDEIKPKVEYLMDGTPVQKELFESFLSVSSESKKQPQERKVKPQTYEIKNIKEIFFDKQKYVVVG